VGSRIILYYSDSIADPRAQLVLQFFNFKNNFALPTYIRVVKDKLCKYIYKK